MEECTSLGIEATSKPYKRVAKGSAKTLIVVYSRTGNILGVAKEVARYFDADLLKIDAPLYTVKYGKLVLIKHCSPVPFKNGLVLRGSSCFTFQL